jgi:hypothetical protein
MKMPAILPESFLRCLDKETRKSLGKAGLSAEEAASRAQIKNHGHFQKMIYNLLRLKGIEPLTAPIGKKSGIRVGWPDVAFAITQKIDLWNGYYIAEHDYRTRAFGWELKIPPDDLSDEQKRMHIRLSTPPNSWEIKVIRSVDEALTELRKLGL